MTDWKWLEEQRKLQVDAFGVDPVAIYGSDRGVYWTEMMLAAGDEISEFGNEIAWKSWAKDRGSIHDRSAALGELVDVMFFVGNLLLTLGASDDEVWERYREKMERNRIRQRANGGYDSKKTKCPACARELDKPGAYVALRVRVGSGAGTQDDVESGVLVHRLECNSCRTQFDYETQRGESLP